ncbi:dihydropyrimidinase [Pelomyxa schiedti]|nr:dihydropyrimidinase [Pelomyxa schiedti]
MSQTEAIANVIVSPNTLWMISVMVSLLPLFARAYLWMKPDRRTSSLLPQHLSPGSSPLSLSSESSEYGRDERGLKTGNNNNNDGSGGCGAESCVRGVMRILAGRIPLVPEWAKKSVFELVLVSQGGVTNRRQGGGLRGCVQRIITPMRCLGVIFLLIGVLCAFSAEGLFSDHGFTPEHGDTVKSLIVEGIYQYTRNPIYVGAICADLGLGFVIDTPFVILYSVGYWAYLEFYVIPIEEKVLTLVFGDQYKQYVATTSRWRMATTCDGASATTTTPGGEPRAKLMLIKGGTVVTDDQVVLADVLVSNGRVAAVIPVALQTPHEVPHGVQVVDATSMLVFCGGVDPHVHLEYPQGPNKIYSCDDFHTGSVAAALGGTTFFIDFVEAKQGETLAQALQARSAAAAQKSVLDFSFHMTFNRVDQQTLSEVPDIIKAGVSSWKIYTAYDGIRLRDNEFLIALDTLRACGGLPIVHAENHDLIMHRLAQYKSMTPPVSPVYHPLTRPVEGEVEATTRALLLAESAKVGAGIHIVHVSAARAIPVIRRQQWLVGSPLGPVTGEVCAHHLVLDDSKYKLPPKEAANFVCAPPIRAETDVKGMWDALAEGTLGFVVTDHCPFTSQQRLGQRRTPEFRWNYATGEKVPSPAEEPWSESMPSFFQMPGGVAGIETRVALTYHYAVNVNKFPLPHFVRLISTMAAKRFGVYPKKGSLQEGADADIVIFDPNKTVTITHGGLHQNCDHTPFEGIQVQGWVDSVIVGGELAVSHGHLETEVIPFRNPGINSSLFVSNLSVSVPDTLLREAFGQFGLLHSVKIFPPKDPANAQTQYASIKFYSVKAARRSLMLNGIPFRGKGINVQLASDRGKDKGYRDATLSMGKGIELCNHYVGFANWSSTICEIAEKSEILDSGKISSFSHCSIRVEFLPLVVPENCPLHVIGKGIGRYVAKNRPLAVSMSRKFAVSSARKNALSKVMILILSTGKVAIVCSPGHEAVRIDASEPLVVNDDSYDEREGDDDEEGSYSLGTHDDNTSH